ncbi:hypothetical protein L195_g040756 [Trifolium pratense]|uniref:Uncharacterized protein n=1 Tax=Trifolium pratense TaxID=57577 RepID=A0A2K3M1S1_TRIPR|nr:hypothetical protein L195_g040756 [Trifolium pratense]
MLDVVWKYMRRLNVPERIKTFVWLMKHDIVMKRLGMYSVADNAVNLKGGAQRSLVDIFRKPSRGGWVRLNLDGACSNEVIYCGGLIRGSDVEWLHGFSEFIGASFQVNRLTGARTRQELMIEAELGLSD